MSRPVASVIVTTYNQPRWLQRCLWGFACQDRHDFELVVADDGSGPETRVLVEAMQSQAPFELRHVWQPDEGFQKCRILNKAIVQARADYLVFTDGDCVPRADFLSQHLCLREPGRFLSGGYCKLPMQVSERIDREAIASGRFANLQWLSAQGLARGQRSSKLWPLHPWQARLMNAITPVKPRWHGHNASAWAADVRRVNGFDERMQYGGEDLEFGERLENAGVRGRQARHSAIVVHLDHGRGYVDPAMRERNEAIRHATRSQRRTRTEHGIAKPAA
ncbi:MAG TPA: glycosyltransferase family 2 protein [Xanthomonadaceae bacterium]|nr:glycosyltransferase family 2 protein [Xanthomonadaceae bacterium]